MGAPLLNFPLRISAVFWVLFVVLRVIFAVLASLWGGGDGRAIQSSDVARRMPQCVIHELKILIALIMYSFPDLISLFAHYKNGHHAFLHCFQLIYIH